MEAIGVGFRNASVVAIYLVHGSFLGQDGLGLLADLARIAPGMADVLRSWNKQLIDSITGDLGNFTQDYADSFQAAINPPGSRFVPVRKFLWSSENHHLGRADGAIRLLDELLAQKFTPDDRVLLICHSHGGNVAALVTNLLICDCDARQEFFYAARNYYRGPILKRVDLPIWDALRLRSGTSNDQWPRLCIDVATLGTPVRYGWDTGGFDHLLHFINHHPAPGLPPYQALFPPTRDDLWYARSGDFIQQVGIAGTNFVPPVWALRACDAEFRLGRLLQAQESATDLFSRLKMGVRAHEDGENLLIDYGPGPGTPAQHLLGHSVYTRKEWLPFHAGQIAQRMYGLTGIS